MFKKCHVNADHHTRRVYLIYIKVLLSRFLSVPRPRRCFANTAELFIFKPSVIDVKQNVYQVQRAEDVCYRCVLGNFFWHNFSSNSLVVELSWTHFHLLTIDRHCSLDFTMPIELSSKCTHFIFIRLHFTSTLPLKYSLLFVHR